MLICRSLVLADLQVPGACSGERIAGLQTKSLLTDKPMDTWTTRQVVARQGSAGCNMIMIFSCFTDWQDLLITMTLSGQKHGSVAAGMSSQFWMVNTSPAGAGQQFPDLFYSRQGNACQYALDALKVKLQQTSVAASVQACHAVLSSAQLKVQTSQIQASCVGSCFYTLAVLFAYAP